MSDTILHELQDNLTQAVKGNDSELLIKHLEDLPAGFDINFSVDEHGHTLLFFVAFHGYIDVINILLKAGAEVNYVNNNGATPLYIAAQEGNWEVVKLLLDEGANVNQARINGATPLIIAAKKGHEEVVSLLIQAGSEVDHATIDGYTSLISASYCGHVEVFEMLIKGGANVNLADKDGDTPISIAVRKDHPEPEIVRMLLEHDDIEVNQVNNNGRTLLSTALLNRHIDVLRLLINKGVDVSQVNNCADFNETRMWSRLSFRAAVEEGYVESVELLIEAGAEISRNMLKMLIRQINDISELDSLCDAIAKGYTYHFVKLAKRYQNQSIEETIDIKSQVKSLPSKIMPNIELSLFEMINSVLSTNLKKELLDDYNKSLFEFESLLNDRGILIESLGSLRGFSGDVGYDFYAQVIEMLPSDDASKKNSCAADETLLETLKGEFISSKDVRFLDLALNLVIEDKLNLENNSARSNIAFQIDNIHALLLQKKRLDVDTKVSLLVKFSAVALIIQDFDQRCGKETWGTHFNDLEDENLSQTEELNTSEYSQESFFRRGHGLWNKENETQLEEKNSPSDNREYESKENKSDNDCQY